MRFFFLFFFAAETAERPEMEAEVAVPVSGNWVLSVSGSFLDFIVF